MVPLSTRVCIIGAGPAGLTAAMQLLYRGYRDVTVLERSLVLGGQCRGLVHQGHVHDLGPSLTSPHDRVVRRLARKVGMALEPVVGRPVILLGPHDQPALHDAGLAGRLVTTKGPSLYEQIRHLTGIDGVGFAGLRDSVDQPLEAWLHRHGLGAFGDAFDVAALAYGFGGMLELPAAYALKLFEPHHLQDLVDVAQGRAEAESATFVEGTQELWRRIDEHFGIGTRTGAEVAEVHRSPRGVEVHWTEDHQVYVDNFDKLIVACPLDAALEFLDSSEDEERLFSQIQSHDCYMTLAQMDDAPPVTTLVEPYARQCTPGQPTVFHPSGDDGVFLFHAHGGPEESTETVRANIESALSGDELAGSVSEFLHTEHWRCFPHVTSEVMAGGWFDDVEAMQGRFHTFYAGEVLSFARLEHVVNYAMALVDDHF